MYRDNPLKQRLQAGRKALGCWLFIGNSVVAEIVGLAGYDFVMIDHEHGPSDLATAITLLQALDATGTPALMRVPDNDPVYIKRALDIGVGGIMVPMIDTAAQAQAAVAACHYPRRGRRGCAVPVVRAADYGFAAPHYLETIEHNLLVVCQIESAHGIRNIEEIAAVDGVDLLFLGPIDIATDMGHLAQPEHAQVAETIADAEARILDTGKPMGTIPRPGHDFQSLFERGHQLVISGSDITLLRDAARAETEAHRQRNE